MPGRPSTRPGAGGARPFIYPPISAAFYRPFARFGEAQSYRALSAVNRILLAAILVLLWSFASYRLRWSWQRLGR